MGVTGGIIECIGKFGESTMGDEVGQLVDTQVQKDCGEGGRVTSLLKLIIGSIQFKPSTKVVNCSLVWGQTVNNNESEPWYWFEGGPFEVALL